MTDFAIFEEQGLYGYQVQQPGQSRQEPCFLQPLPGVQRIVTPLPSDTTVHAIVQLAVGASTTRLHREASESAFNDAQLSAVDENSPLMCGQCSYCGASNCSGKCGAAGGG